jgi:hypothetical protein
VALSYNEIRRRAIEFAREYEDATRENAESQSFYNDFFNIFGIRRRRVASFEEPVKKLGDRRGRIDLFWKGTLLVEQKSKNSDLENAYAQALEYFPNLKEAELPKYVLVSDFQNFELYDLEDGSGVPHKFSLQELPQNVERFAFIAGYRKREYKDHDPVNIEASELMGQVHDALKEAGYVGHELDVLLVRLVFCLFADHTGIFERDQFHFFLEERTHEDGSDLGPMLALLFEVLNTSESDRQRNIDEVLSAFPYINGDLFKERIAIAAFDAVIRQRVLDASLFDWSRISPAIFGSLFQSVMDKQKRRGIGAHYTTEQNILKVIRPLFLDELRDEFERIRKSKSRLRQLHDKLGRLRFLDPACGCGNFLIITYRELRRLEIDILEALFSDRDVQFEMNIARLTKIDVDAFFGIEIEEFPVRIAEVALWLTDHLMNIELSQAFGLYFARIPLRKSPHIHHANALRLDWHAVTAADQNLYVMGNPPFVGKQHRTEAQQSDMEAVFGTTGGAGILDYVAAWYLKASRFIHDQPIKCAFVSTNSICQGEQTPALWKSLIYEQKIKIHFAHRAFAWGSEARGAANVHVVVIGFGKQEVAIKRLFDYDNAKGDPHETRVANINPYLIDYSDKIIEPRTTPICDAPPIIYGSKPVDEGHFFFTNEEKEVFLKAEPAAKKFIRPVIAANEYLYGIGRWCLWLRGATPSELRRMPLVMDRIEKIKVFRKKSKKIPTQEAAKRATEFAEIRQPSRPYVLIPMHTSEDRTYVPFGFFSPDYIVHNSCTCIPDATPFHFGVLSSLMHMTWMRYICGRLESRYRYANTLVYNNFPWPITITAQAKKRIEDAAQMILVARNNHPGSTPADLYDPLTMPTDLSKAHAELDQAVDRAYRSQRFNSERERIEFLFALHDKYTTPLLPVAPAPRRRR